jgi:hypothetical protein
VLAAQSVLALGQQWVAKRTRFCGQIMFAIGLLKHVVLSKSEGPQKWLALCFTELLVQLMSVSLSRNRIGKLK